MARVTSKRQVTLPKAIADRYGVGPGDDIEFVPAGEAILVRRAGVPATGLDRRQRLERFDRATERQRARQATGRVPATVDRGWRREALYERDRAR